MLNPFTHRKILRRGTPGRATIVEMGALERGGTSFNLPMTLQVFVEGMTPYEVEDQWMVKAKDTVALSGWIPVRVDRDEPTRVAIDWDGVRENHAREKTARRDALARGNAFGGATINIGEPQVIDVGGNPQGSEQIQQMLGALGFEANARPGGSGGDDVIGKLERLSALRAAGALTDEEFERQKRRILGEA